MRGFVLRGSLSLGALIAGSTVLFGAGIALAQEATVTLSTAGGYDWSGYYAGASLGYADGETTAVPIDQGRPPNSLYGGLFGAQFGYNMQSGNLVYGVEAAVTSGSVDTPSTSTNCSSVHCEFVDINWTASISARVGQSFDRTLVYGTLGYAVADVTAIDWDAGTESATHQHDGVVVGVGVEHAFSDTLSGVAEYTFTDYSTENYDLGDPDDVDFETSVVKFGLNYHF